VPLFSTVHEAPVMLPACHGVGRTNRKLPCHVRWPPSASVCDVGHQKKMRMPSHPADGTENTTAMPPPSILFTTCTQDIRKNTASRKQQPWCSLDTAACSIHSHTTNRVDSPLQHTALEPAHARAVVSLEAGCDGDSGDRLL